MPKQLYVYFMTHAAFLTAPPSRLRPTPTIQKEQIKDRAAILYEAQVERRDTSSAAHAKRPDRRTTASMVY